MALSFRNRPSLVAYLTCGDPDLATTRKIALATIDAGANVIELGVPFSDPLADGPVIQRASERAVANGTKLADVLALAAEVRKLRPQAGLIIFSYLNPVCQRTRSASWDYVAPGADAGKGTSPAFTGWTHHLYLFKSDHAHGNGKICCRRRGRRY